MDYLVYRVPVWIDVIAKSPDDAFDLVVDVADLIDIGGDIREVLIGAPHRHTYVTRELDAESEDPGG